jgi:hypothetical protein
MTWAIRTHRSSAVVSWSVVPRTPHFPWMIQSLTLRDQQAPTTRAVHQGIIRFRWEGRARKVAVNVVNAQGVWNLARDSPNVAAPW